MTAAPAKRTIRYADLPAGLRGQFTAAKFNSLIDSKEQATHEQVVAGQNEQLARYILQSNHFTLKARIEPSFSAREFNQRGEIPGTVRARMDDFELALNRPAKDPRMVYFQSFVPGRGLRPYVEKAYADAMRAWDQPARSHSTDTSVEANFAVWTALSVLKGLQPAIQLTRVLVVGPGLDFAPRTALVDEFPPQSYQPFAVADALLGLRLARPGLLRIQCVDVDSRVADFFQRFPLGDRKLNLVSNLPESSLAADYKEYFAQLGGAIGKQGGVDVPPALNSRARKSLVVRKDIAAAIGADTLDILTERYDPSPQYELAIVTNVLVSFEKDDLALALANISAMMKPGGYLVHNDLRAEVASLGEIAGFNPVQGRTLKLGEQLSDSFVIQKKR